MQECNFMLSLLLLLSERLACHGVAAQLAETESSSMLPSTVQETLGHYTTVAFLTSGDPHRQSATPLIGRSATPLTQTGTPPTTETEDISSHEIEDLNPVLIFGVPAALVLILLVLLIFFIVRRHKQKQHKQEELGSENCKSPIFEEDTPSVMEIEMEELDKWMNSLKRNAECAKNLAPVKEEKDLNANTSDCEL